MFCSCHDFLSEQGEKELVMLLIFLGAGKQSKKNEEEERKKLKSD